MRHGRECSGSQRRERAWGWGGELGGVKESFMEEGAYQLTPKRRERFGHPEKGCEAFPTRGYDKSKDIKGRC